MIPRRLIRVWVGEKPIKERYEEWWEQFQTMHFGWDALTLGDADVEEMLEPYPALQEIYDDVATQASRADIGRYLALQRLGGIYVDCDVMPLKPLTPLLLDARPFAGKQSSKSVVNAVMGAPPAHPAVDALLEALPEWYWPRRHRAPSVCTTGVVSHVWWNRDDVRKLPKDTFYPYKFLFGDTKAQKEERIAAGDWPEETLAVHYAGQGWGGKPKRKVR